MNRLLLAYLLGAMIASPCKAQRNNYAVVGWTYAWLEPDKFGFEHLFCHVDPAEGSGWRFGWTNGPGRTSRIGVQSGIYINIQHTQGGIGYSDRYMTTVYSFSGTQELTMVSFEIPALLSLRIHRSARFNAGLVLQGGSVRSNEYGMRTKMAYGSPDVTEFVTDIGGPFEDLSLSSGAVAGGFTFGAWHGLSLDVSGSTWITSIHLNSDSHLYSLRACLAYDLSMLKQRSKIGTPTSLVQPGT